MAAELLPHVPADHRAPFWSRFWSHVELPSGLIMTPEIADQYWAQRTPETLTTCPWWHWRGAIHATAGHGKRRESGQYEQAVYGYLITKGKGYSTHLLAWAYCHGHRVPHHYRVRREDHCRMFVEGRQFDQLCMWPGCMRLEKSNQVPDLSEAYSVRLEADPTTPGIWYRNVEWQQDHWEVLDYSKDKPRFAEIFE